MLDLQEEGFYGVGQLLARETYWADVADEAAPIPCTYC